MFADILKERFANFYPAAMDILFRCLETHNAVVLGAGALSSKQIQAVAKDQSAVNVCTKTCPSSISSPEHS
jgi:hypothetical protein